MSDSKTGKDKAKGALETVAKVGAVVGTVAGAIATLIKTNKD